VVLGAAYLLWLYQRVFFGPVSNPKNQNLPDLSPREIVTFAPLVVLAFWIGIYPKPFFEILAPPVNKIVRTVRPDYPIAPPALPRTAQAPAATPAAASPARAEGNR
jgi:NADH-quinone oxidoreductase subunit M